MTVPELMVRVAGRLVASETTVAAVGGYVLVAETVVTDPGRLVGLVSTYTGLVEAGGIAVITRLVMAPGEPVTFSRGELGPDVVGDSRAQAVLLDHVAALQDLLARIAGASVAVAVSDAGLAALEVL